MISKTAMITICGRPNVGKSTLTNALAGEKIAIVSNKPQTTRNRITAVCQRGETQFVFLDTPGFHKPRTRLGDYMVNVVRQSVADVDAVVLGCTHFPFARRAIRAALGGVALYDGSDGTARETQRQLVRRGWIRGGTHGTVSLENSLPSELPLSRRLLDLPAED